MGTLEKVAFTFGSRFWPDDVRRVTRVTADRSFPAWVDMTDHAGTPTLVALFNPTSTPGLSPDPGGRAAVALAALGSMFRHPPPIAAHATDWAGDAFSRGSYSFVPVGASAADMRTLGTPVSRRVVLAGEHTVPRYFGTVHGAYVSGLEAARHLTG